jgi:acetate kinase
MRTLSEKAAQGELRACLAIGIFCYRVRKYLGAYTAVLGTLDAVVFTGGIGENAVQVRHEICRDLDQIGIKIDSAKNQQVVQTEGEISTPESQVRVFVIPTNEEAAIATDTFQIVKEIRP